MRRLACLAFIAVLLAGCGEDGAGLTENKPSTDEILDEAEWTEWQDPDGQPLWCATFIEQGYHRSWLAFTCVPRGEQ